MCVRACVCTKIIKGFVCERECICVIICVCVRKCTKKNEWMCVWVLKAAKACSSDFNVQKHGLTLFSTFCPCTFLQQKMNILQSL